MGMADRMKRREISDKEKNLAVARILSGRATVQQIAEELQVSEQAVRSWRRDRRPAPTAKPAPKESVSPSLQGPGHTAPGSLNPQAPGAKTSPDDPLARARAAAGIPAGGAPAAALPGDDVMRAADQADRELVVQTAMDLKAAGLQLIAAKAGLPEDDPDLKKISGLTPVAATALQANASWIAPIIREKVQGKLALVVALGIEAVFTFAALKALLKARGLLKEKEKKPDQEDEKPEESKP
jgi:transposase-like protein